MICAVITIVLAIISFFYPWFFIGAIVGIVLCVTEFIIEGITSKFLSYTPLAIGAAVLGVIALVLTIISIVTSLRAINSDNGNIPLVMSLLF